MSLSSANLRVILLEDDAVAAEVLSHHLQALGYHVFGFDRLATLRQDGHACLPAAVALLDLSLPDGSGLDALPLLRGQCRRLIATSADWSAESEQRMRAAGFDACLAKPCTREALAALLTQDSSALNLVCEATIPTAWSAPLPILDDAQAARTLGSSQAVFAMRVLFRDELLGMQARLQAAATQTDPEPERALLHRLAASAGFVGATALKAAVARRQAERSPASEQALQAAVVDCLQALSAD